MDEEPRLYTDSPDPLNLVAQERFGVSYLYPYQRLVISNILEAAAGLPDRESPGQIVILPTGSGKSLCFTLPAVLLDGPTLVIFPLLALMADQARRLSEAGLDVCILKGGQSEAERDEMLKGVRAGRTKIIISNPETLRSERMRGRLKEIGIAHLVIDETHTASEWGDSFRPAYLEIRGIAEALGRPVITAFTATASEHILARVRDIVFGGGSPLLVAGNPDRPNIRYRVIPSISKDHDIERLAREEKRPLIIFCRSRDGAELTARSLRVRLKEDAVRFYHAGLTREEKRSVEEWFFASGDGILCSTCAYGMGVDKKNIRTVIHRDLPPSVESYLQESGRGGRDGMPTEAVLLCSREDEEHSLLLRGKTEKDRYEALLAMTRQNARCRRASLLSLLGAEPELCSGCDVCERTVQVLPAGYEEIFDAVRRFPRRYAEGDLSIILSDTKERGVSVLERRFSSQERRLRGWSEDDVKAALGELCFRGIVRRVKRGPFAGRLLPGKGL